MQDLKEKGVKVWLWDEFVSYGGELDEKSYPPAPPEAEDVCTYMYTSGTTGELQNSWKHDIIVSVLNGPL